MNTSITAFGKSKIKIPMFALILSLTIAALGFLILGLKTNPNLFKGQLGLVTPTLQQSSKLTRKVAVDILVRAAELPPLKARNPSFVDVGEDHPYFQVIESAFAAGLIQGYANGTFQPENSVNRAEFARLAERAFGLDVVSGTAAGYPHFSDVSSNYWYAAAVQSIYQFGGIEISYSPAAVETVTNATKIANNLKTKMLTFSRAFLTERLVEKLNLTMTVPCGSSPFPDVPISHPSCPAIQAVVNAGIFTGTTTPEGDFFLPDARLTRGQVAVMAARIFEIDDPSVSDGNSIFSDVTPNRYFYEAVESLVRAGLIKGYYDETFRPNIPAQTWFLRDLFEHF